MATRMKAKPAIGGGRAASPRSPRNRRYIAAAAMTTNGTVSAGVTDANNIFNGTMATASGSRFVVTSVSPRRHQAGFERQFSAKCRRPS